MPSAYRTLAAAALLAIADGLAAPPRRLPTPSPKVRQCDAAHGAAPRLLAPAAGASPDGYVGVYKPPGWRVEPLASALPAGVERAPDVRTWLAATTGAVGAAVFDLDVDCGGCVAFALPGAAAADPATAEFVAVLSGSLAAPRGELAGARYVARTGGAWTGHGTVVDVVARVPPEAAGRRAPSLAVREAFAALGNPVRGDARFGEPIDRAAPRALIHCAKIKVGGAAFAAPRVEDDMALACGGAAADARAALRASDSTTTAYRAVHGEADGAAGTTVDRYVERTLRCCCCYHACPATPTTVLSITLLTNSPRLSGTATTPSSRARTARPPRATAPPSRPPSPACAACTTSSLSRTAPAAISCRSPLRPARPRRRRWP